MCNQLMHVFALQNWSTSPKQEPAHFCDQTRRALCIVRDYPDPRKSLFPDNQPRTFYKQSSGLWAACQWFKH